MNLKTLYWIPLTCLTFYALILLISRQSDNFQFGVNPLYQKGRTLTIGCCNGRLGNKMSVYAVLYGLAKLNQRQAVLPLCNAHDLLKIFQINLPVIPLFPKEIWRGHRIGWHYDPKRDGIIPINANILTGNQYPDSFTFFDFARLDIRKEFTFKKLYRDYAENVLNEAKSGRNVSMFIGVHVRRDDYLTQLKYMNRRMATKRYFDAAFDYFRRKYNNVLFVVASDDIKWCKENFLDDDVFFQSNPVKGEFDLAMLAHCNHSVITYGTFGFWSAYLAGGETVYIANSTAPGSWFDLEEPERTFYLPNWTGISENSANFWDDFPVISKLPRFVFD